MAMIDDHADERVARAEARAEAAESRLRTQTMLIAEAGHRLKTALAIINGWASTLEERWDQLDDERRLQGLAVIRRTSGTMAIETRRLLDDARAEIRLLDLAPVVLDLREVLDVNVAMLEGLSQTHAIAHATAPDEDVTVCVDPGALQQVLGHLLENAVKYSPGGTTVVVAARRVDDDVVIDVRDDGVGVPTDIDVFAPFERGDARIEGVGLGLYIVRNLVRAMGGDVTALRNPDRGSTFSVRLPA
jgi:two-component system, NtrC family, sensor histidine kinase KinB